MRPAVFNSRPIPQLTQATKHRVDEVIFYFIINQIEINKKTAAAPYGSTLPKILASMMRGVNPEVIDYAYRQLSTEVDRPTTQDIVVALKYYKVPYAKAPFTPNTYFKWWVKWHEAGCPFGDTVLSELQIAEVRKFIRNYIDIFRGRKKGLMALCGNN